MLLIMEAAPQKGFLADAIVVVVVAMLETGVGSTELVGSGTGLHEMYAELGERATELEAGAPATFEAWPTMLKIAETLAHGSYRAASKDAKAVVAAAELEGRTTELEISDVESSGRSVSEILAE
jgi:hypothetical protein